MPPDPQRVEAVFTAAIGLVDPVARAAYLERACEGDAALRARVEQLIAADAGVGSFLNHPLPGGQGPPGRAAPPTVVQGVGQAAAPEPGTWIDRYKLLQPIERGGMGEVWMAEQTEPVHRRVAVKLIRPGLDSRQVVARFEAERQALALMDHPNIAKALDAGATPDGRPFFVMELVKGGVPITAYCDERRLTPRERLLLFVDVCRAVQHAHTKGIIHRDIKPPNVLIAPYDGRPVPKVIDFGIAKALGQPLTDTTLFTALGVVVGTPVYMSPEQAALNNLDVDTRSDVYSLGVLLYELLTGSTPLTRERVSTLDLLNALRLVREEEPPRPSVRLSTTAELPAVAAARGLDPRGLSRLVQGELDWIVMRALEKGRNRRYDTAADLARDVERYMANEPVEAARPSAAYRLRKFYRRNRVPVVTAGLVLFALVAGMAGTTWGLLEAQAQKGAALDAAGREREAREVAERRLGMIARGNEILASVFKDLSPRAAERGEPLAALLAARLDRAAELLVGDAVGDPVVVARLQNALGNSYRELGYPEKAIGLLTLARDTLEAAAGPDHPDTLATLNHLALAYLAAGRTAEAVALHERVRDACVRVFGEADPVTLVTLNNLANAYQHAGRLADAVALHERVRDTEVRLLGREHPGTLLAQNNLAGAYQAAGRVPEAIRLYEHVRDVRVRTSGAEHPDTLDVLNNLGVAYHVAGRLPEAIALHERVRDVQVRTLGPDHPVTLIALNNLASAYQAADRVPEAIRLYESVRDAQVRRLGTEHPLTLTTLNNLGDACRVAGRVPDAITLHERVRDVQVRFLGQTHPNTLSTLNNLALAYEAAGRPADAVTLFERVRDMRTQKLGPAHPETLSTLHNLAGACRTAGRSDQAIKLFEQVRGQRASLLGPGHPDTVNTANSLANTYLAARRTGDAINLLERVQEVLPDTIGREHPAALSALNTLAGAYLLVQKFPDAVRLFEEICATQARLCGPDHPKTLTFRHNLAGAYRAAGRLGDAVAAYEPIRERRAREFGPDHPDALATANDLAVAYMMAGRTADAVPLLEEVRRGFVAQFGPDHPDTVVSTNNLIAALELLGRYARAAEVREGIVVHLRRRGPAEEPRLAGELAALGLCLLHAGKPGAAESVLRECLELRERHQPGAWVTFNTRSMLGGALLGQKRYAEAELLLLAGYQGMKERRGSIPPAAQARLAEAADRLVELYTALRDPGQVSRWRAERAAYPPDRAPPPRPVG
jgi:tetratricopeptide (TPR) repeat protein